MSHEDIHEVHEVNVGLVIDVRRSYVEARRHEVPDGSVGLDVLWTSSRVCGLGAIEALTSCVVVAFVTP